MSLPLVSRTQVPLMNFLPIFVSYSLFQEERMDYRDAQREAREIFLGGSVGQAVTGTLWLVSTLFGTLVGVRAAMGALFLGGFLSFPITQEVLKLMGRPVSLKKENPLSNYTLLSVLAMTLLYPLVYASCLRNINWFYPSFLIIVGTHYLSFVALYGLLHYLVLGIVMAGGGILIGLLLPHSFTAGGWFGALLLLSFPPLLYLGSLKKSFSP